ncbi:MAG: GNAT family N-acetyltransferase [Alphaproteobacteria bacterium]|nr:GNAT family N-acetyltransferase [Alphaproteobacteria bacterium]
MFIANGQTAFAPVIAELHQNCFWASWSESDIRDLLCLSTTVGWLTEASFLLCSRVADEMEILTIGVLPTCRRQGLAASLMTEMISYARQNHIHRIFLEVSAQNEPAQRLYDHFGFIQTGIRPGYYKTADGMVDALCLTKTLD